MTEPAVRGFFDSRVDQLDTIDHGWVLRFREHRIAHRRILRPMGVSSLARGSRVSARLRFPRPLGVLDARRNAAESAEYPSALHLAADAAGLRVDGASRMCRPRAP